MWTHKKEREFLKKKAERKAGLLDIMNFIELQLLEYAAQIDEDLFDNEHDNSTELLDFFEWYIEEGLHKNVEMDICINVVNFLFFKNFDLDMFEFEDEE